MGEVRPIGKKAKKMIKNRQNGTNKNQNTDKKVKIMVRKI